ncbi:MAG: AAA family ATPase [Acidimicrobiia bacterium]|nr:AAA family ATPase [Acidimicrobiia bacterium]
MPSPRCLVLIVDADPGFVEDARMLFAGQRVLTARTLDEAGEIVPGGRVGVAVLGPSLGSEEGITAAGGLRTVDPTLPLAMVANLVTNRMMLAGMKTGLACVVETPLTLRKVDEILAVARGGHTPVTAAPAGTDEAVVGIELEAVSGPAVSAAFITQPVALPPRVAAPPVAPTPPPPPAPAAPRPRVTDADLFAPDPDWERAAPARTPSLAPPRPTPPSPGPIEVLDHPIPVATVGPIEELPPVWEMEVAPGAAPVAPPARRPDEVMGEATSRFAPVVEAMAPPPMVTAAPSVAYPPPPSSPPPMAPPRPVDEVVVIHPEGTVPLRAGMPASPFERPEPPVRPGIQRAAGGGRVVAVMAGKGGSGKTVTATNLAMALTMQRGDDRVVIVDTDLQFGDVALLLQMDPSRTLLDVSRRIDEISDAKLESMLLRHESGLRVLPAPVLPVSEEEVPAKVIAAVVDRLRALYDIVVIDTPPIFDDHLITVLEQADDVLVVVDMDLPSVKNAKIALDALRGSGFPMGRLQLVVNRVNAKARLDLVELERSLGLRVAGSIPSDRLVPQSVNEGIPVVALSPRSRVARAFHVLAGLIRLGDAPSR